MTDLDSAAPSPSAGSPVGSESLTVPPHAGVCGQAKWITRLSGQAVRMPSRQKTGLGTHANGSES
jgi:hypothetical protein